MRPAYVTALSAEVTAALRRCGKIRRGLAFLHRAPVESVAVALGVHPDLVERVRAALDRPGERMLAIAEFIAGAAEPAGDELQPVPAGSAPEHPGELIRLAEGRPGGLELLAGATLETAAVMFGVHPRLVIEARQTLAR